VPPARIELAAHGLGRCLESLTILINIK